MTKTQIAAAILLSTLSATIFAEEVIEEQPVTQTESARLGWNISGVMGSVSDDAQFENGVGDSFWGLSMGANWDFPSNWNAELGMVIYNFDDSDEFSQLTQDGWGDISSSTSDVVGIGGYGEFGYLKKFNSGNNWAMGANLGYEFLDVNREIGSCVDCYSEDVDISGGLYFRPFVNFQAGETTEIEISYKHPFSDELEGVFQFGLIFYPY